MGNTDDAKAIAGYRDYLLRYALFRLRDEATAEEVVQDTLLAALQAQSGFAAQSSLKTWLTGILKHKLIDAQRRLGRDPLLLDERLDDEGEVGDFDSLFDTRGHWGSDAPGRWAAPDATIEAQDFWRAYADCVGLLPKRTAMVFTLRESMGWEIDEICQNLDISATNCSVMLYRARMSLRLCLEKNWFGNDA